MVYKSFDKKYALLADKSASSAAVKNENMSNLRPLGISKRELTEELHKSIIRKFEKRKVHSSSTDNILVADFADMQLINKINKGIRFLLCVIDIFSKYLWVIPLKDKKRYYIY